MSDALHQHQTAQATIAAPQSAAAATPASTKRASAPLILLAAASVALLAYQVYDKAVPFHGDRISSTEASARAAEWQQATSAPIGLETYGINVRTLLDRARGIGFPAPLEADLGAAGFLPGDIDLMLQHIAVGDLRFCRLQIRDGNVFDGDRIRITTIGGKIPAGAEGLTIDIDLPAVPRSIPVPCGAQITITAVADGRGGGVVADIAGRRAPVMKLNERVNLQAR